MIEFKGELTGKCRNFLLQKQIKIQMIASLITAIIFSIPTILIASFWYIAALLFLIPLIFFVMFSLVTPSKQSQKIFMPKRIYLDLNEETIVHECEKMERFHMITSVKSVIDYGEWYYFIFNYVDRDPYFVCQKNLLTKGTLVEFEALFSDKIIRCQK